MSSIIQADRTSAKRVIGAATPASRRASVLRGQHRARVSAAGDLIS